MEHNTRPIILIGSRAWTKDFGTARTTDTETDWDLVVNSKLLTDLLHGREFYHYHPQLEEGKISVVHQSGAKLEFEIMDKFESAKVLKVLSKDRTEALLLQNQTSQSDGSAPKVPIVWSVNANIPSKEALLVLKASHIYFPVNWRKNLQKLMTMLCSFPKSFSKVVKEDPSAALLKELFQTRARETLHRVKSRVHVSTQRIFAPTMQEVRESAKDCYDRAEFLFKELEQTKEDPADTFYLPSTGLKLSKAAWLKYGPEEFVGKSQIIYEQLVLLALHYYLPQLRNYGALSSMPKPARINELFLLCLETFFTQHLAPMTAPSKPHREYKSCMPIPGEDIAADLFEVDLYETVPLASNAELAKTTFANPMVNWLLDNIATEYERLHDAFVRALMQVPDQLFTYKPVALPYLPFEIIEMIQDSVADDHVVMSKLCRVCRSWNRYFSENYKWQPLCDKFDEQTIALAQKHLADRHVQHRGDWKVVFREVYEMMPTAHTVTKCEHCHDMHLKRAGYDYQALEEEYWGRCACPDCDAGSWTDCQYHSDFLFTI